MTADKKPERKIIHIPEKSGRAFEVPAGYTLRVIDVQGSQIGDFICYSSKDYREVFSQAKTRTYNWKVNLTTGDKLYSNRDQVMFTIGKDIVGVHDILFSACNRYVFKNIYNVGERTGCQEHLADALKEYGLTLDDICAPLNVFMATSIDDNGELVIHRAPSKPGDYVDLIAEMDLLAAISACAVDLEEGNGGVCTDLRVEIIPGK